MVLWHLNLRYRIPGLVKNKAKLVGALRDVAATPASVIVIGHGAGLEIDTLLWSLTVPLVSEKNPHARHCQALFIHHNSARRHGRIHFDGVISRRGPKADRFRNMSFRGYKNIRTAILRSVI